MKVNEGMRNEKSEPQVYACVHSSDVDRLTKQIIFCPTLLGDPPLIINSVHNDAVKCGDSRLPRGQESTKTLSKPPSTSTATQSWQS